MRQALERMERYRYAAVPVLTPDGRYEATLTEGDLAVVHEKQPAGELPKTPNAFRFPAVPRRLPSSRSKSTPRSRNCSPWPTSRTRAGRGRRKAFIGIVTRKSILTWFAEKCPPDGRLPPDRPARQPIGSDAA